MKKISLLQNENIIALLLFGAVALVFMFNSPLHPWIGGSTSIDSSVFKTVVTESLDCLQT